MSMPIISLPVERIERHKNAEDRGYADDRDIDPRLAGSGRHRSGQPEAEERSFLRTRRVELR